jgi:dTDP-4-dehydrorhamnose reductase
MENKILITGGTGRLAHELKKHLVGEYVGIEHWDFIYAEEIPKGEYDIILHMGAYTEVPKAEREAEKCMLTNVQGTFNMVQKYKDTPFIYISTEWAHKPLGVYALSKQLGEEIVKTHPNHLILRTLFKPNPWPFEYAYRDQMTQGDYVDVVAEILANIVKTWDKKTPQNSIQFLGTGRKSIIELAKKTKPDVKENSVDDWNKTLGKVIVPYDYQD